MKDLTLTRSALYELIWRSSLKTIAASHGLNPTRIAEACRAADIPLPPPGHWTRVEMNLPIAVTPLPEGREAEEMVTIRPVAQRSRAAVKESAPHKPNSKPALPHAPQAAEPPQSAQPPSASKVKTDPLVRAWIEDNERKRREAKREGWGASMYPDLGDPIQHRRLQIYSDLFGRLRAEGFALTAEHGPDQGIKATRLKHDVFIHIYERRTKGRRPLSADERSRPWNKGVVDTYHLNPTGDLVLKLKGNFYQEVVSEFRDRPGHSLEQQLSDVVTNVEGAIQESIRRAETRAREEQAAREAQWERRRREEERRKQEERRQRLLGLAAEWREAALLREFFQAVEATAPQDTVASSEFRAWLEWARGEAARLDPIASDRIDLSDRG